MSTKAIFYTIGLSLILPFLEGIEPGSVCMLVLLITINLIYCITKYLAIIFENALNLQYRITLIIRLSLLIIYILVICCIFQDKWWVMGSVLFPEIFLEKK